MPRVSSSFQTQAAPAASRTEARIKPIDAHEPRVGGRALAAGVGLGLAQTLVELAQRLDAGLVLGVLPAVAVERAAQTPRAGCARASRAARGR